MINLTNSDGNYITMINLTVILKMMFKKLYPSEDMNI